METADTAPSATQAKVSEGKRNPAEVEQGKLRDAIPRFTVLRAWRSLRSGASYPVAMRLTLDSRELELQPLLDDQELDTRASTGTVYWEGAVRVLENGRQIGRGYLELTGYAGRISL